MSLCADAIANCEREAGVFIVSEEPKMLEALPDTIHRRIQLRIMQSSWFGRNPESTGRRTC